MRRILRPKTTTTGPKRTRMGGRMCTVYCSSEVKRRCEVYLTWKVRGLPPVDLATDIGPQEERVVRKTRKRAGLGGGEQLRHTQTQTRRGQGKDTVSLRGRRRKRQNKGGRGRGVVVADANSERSIHLNILWIVSSWNWNAGGVNIMWEFFGAMHHNNPLRKNNKPGTSNGMFSENQTDLAHISANRQNFEGDWTNLSITFRQTSQCVSLLLLVKPGCYRWRLPVSAMGNECLCAPQCFTKLFPKPVWSKVKISYPPFFILLLKWNHQSQSLPALLLPLLLRILTSACSSCFLVSSQLEGRWLVMESTAILGPAENALFWRLARWMREISEWSGCCARMQNNYGFAGFRKKINAKFNCQFSFD